MAMGMRLVVASVLVACCLAWQPPPGYPKAMPQYEVNLDTPAEQRWEHIIDSLVSIHGVPGTLGNLVRYWNEAIPHELQKLVIDLADIAELRLDSEFVKEMRGAHKAVAKYDKTLTFPMIVALNIIYELSAGCTSIVARDANNGIWHGRNLDWTTEKGAGFSNITVGLNYTMGGKVLYSGVSFAGYVGSLTGMRQGAFAVTIDERDTTDPIQLLMNMIHIDEQHLPVTWLARKALHSKTSYADAVSAFSQTKIAGPCYYIISGTGGMEGSVVTRNFDTAVDGVWSIPHSYEPWYIFETNYDHWKSPPKRDDRRATAKRALAEVGQARMNAQTMLHVLSTPMNNGTRGVMNSMTQYSVVMQPSTGYFHKQIDQP